MAVNTIIGLIALQCLRCGHMWMPRLSREPKVCPQCNSPYWNKTKWKGIKKKSETSDVPQINNSEQDVQSSEREDTSTIATSNLDPLFKPRAVAVIGASNKSGAVGRIIFENLLRSDRPVYPVHPSENTILGRPVYKRVEDLPMDVDLAVIATSAARTVEAAEACGRHGIPFIIPVAGGFSETGADGKLLEDRLKQVTTDYGSRILGPNTLGIFAPRERIDTIFVEHGDRALGQGGGVAFLTQSGSVGVEALGIESNIGFGLRSFVGLGNKIDLDEVDFLNYFRDDPRTTCVTLYIESLPKGLSFLKAARDVSRKKPVVALKAGRTTSAVTAISSHTGQIAGSDRVIDGAFRQFGIQRVFDEEQLCDAARVLSLVMPPRGNRVAVISPAGGYGVMATDEIEINNSNTPLVMAKLSPETESAIRTVAPSFGSVHNPVDLTPSATDDMTITALSTMLNDDGIDIILCMALFAPPGISDNLIRRIASLTSNTTKPIIVVSQFGPFSNGHISRLYDYGVVGYPSVVRGVNAVRWLVERAQIQKQSV
jgi:acyl-CoA synthetase (NDP forming)